MQNVLLEGRCPSRSHLFAHMDVSLLVYEELIDMIASQKRATEREIQELRTMLSKAGSESRRGSVWIIKELVAIGQKPCL